MLQIKVTSRFPKEPVVRQTPGRKGIWHDYQFLVNDPATRECDYWVVYNALNQPEQTFCRAGRSILITSEPPEANTYNPAFLKQFDLIITCHTDLKHPNIRLQHQGLPWHIGLERPKDGIRGEHNFKCMLDYDSLQTMPVPEKKADLSVVLAKHTHHPAHRLRLKFVEALKQDFGEQIDVYGGGIRPLVDKLEGIAPYKYHLVLENSFTAHWWTEKLADAYLGFSYPIFWGCPNIEEYFEPQSMTRIDIENSVEAVATIKRVIQEKTYERDFKHLVAARQLVLDKYNYFEVVRKACLSLPAKQPRSIKLKPEHLFGLWKARRLLRRIHGKVKRMGILRKTSLRA